MWLTYVASAAMFSSLPNASWSAWVTPAAMDCAGSHTSVRMATTGQSEILWGNTTWTEPAGGTFAGGFVDIDIFSLGDNVNTIFEVAVNGDVVNTETPFVNTRAVHTFNATRAGFPRTVALQLRGGDVRSYLMCISFRALFSGIGTTGLATTAGGGTTGLTTGLTTTAGLTAVASSTTGLTTSSPTTAGPTTDSSPTTAGLTTDSSTTTTASSMTTAAGLTTGVSTTTTTAASLTTSAEQSGDSRENGGAVFAWFVLALVLACACAFPVVGRLTARQVRPIAEVEVTPAGTVWWAGHEAHVRAFAMSPGTVQRDALRLRHPHLAPCIAFTPRGEAVFAVPQGARTLEQALLTDTISDAQLLVYCSQIGAALEYLHGRGLAHGRVSLGGVVFAPDNRSMLVLDYLNAPADATAQGDVRGLGQLVWAALHGGTSPALKADDRVSGALFALLRACHKRERPAMSEVIADLQREAASSGDIVFQPSPH